MSEGTPRKAAINQVAPDNEKHQQQEQQLPSEDNREPDGVWMSDDDVKEQLQWTWQRYVYLVPLLNIVYDLLGGAEPDFQTIKSLIETNGVVSALIFSICMATPSFMTYEDWDKVSELFDDEDGPYYECSFSFNFLVSTYTAERNRSILYVLLALIITLLIAIEINASELEKGDFEMLSSWWSVNRFLIFSVFVLMILGIAAMIRALVYHTIMTTPNPYVMQNGCDTYTDVVADGGYFTSIAFTRDSGNTSNTWANTALFAFLATVPGSTVTMLIWSLWIVSVRKKKLIIDAKDAKDEKTRRSRPVTMSTKS